MTLQNDTISCNTERLSEYVGDPAYDYNRELATPEIDVYQYLIRWLSRILDKIFGSRFAEVYTEPILIGLFVLVIVLIVWFVYKKRPELFQRSPKVPLTYAVEEDTIYGVAFADRIDEALARKDFKEAARLLYLQTLKELSDKELINWQLYKTPTEYIYEIKPEKGREPFRELTNNFLRIRYGNFEANEPLFDEMKALQKNLRKEVQHEG